MRLSALNLCSVVHFTDAIELLETTKLIDEERAKEMHGFALRSAGYKESLIGIPFMIVEAEILPGKDHSQYAQLIIIDVEDRKSTIRDSSRGIFEQVSTLVEQTRTPILHGIYVRKGLRYEEYPFNHPGTGQTTITRTYYLDF